EYAHAMGNSVGNIKEFWDQWRKTKRVIGGCIWEFKDQGLLKKDSAGIEYYAYGGDFGEKYFDNFTIKGIVAADGRPKAAMYECKRVFQTIQCEWIDSTKGLIRLINRSEVVNANKYGTVLEVREDGKTILNKMIGGISVPPGGEVVFDFSPWLPKMKADAEYEATLHFVLLKDAPWAELGFDIASNQLVIRKPALAVRKPDATGGVRCSETNEFVVVTGNDFTLKIAKLAPGSLSSYVYKSKEQIFQPLLPHFKRPLTDNDRRGWKPNRRMKQWYEYTLKLMDTRIWNSSSNELHVTTFFTLINDSAKVNIDYTIKKNGVVKVEYFIDVRPGLPNIPKVGMQAGINKNYTQITYFGNGPLENYIDRRFGMDAGVYNQKIYEFMEPYVVPQENGNRTDVRWMYLSDPKTKDGLLIVADSLLSMSAWPYTEENLENAKHTNKLVAAGYITLNIDLVQMGVGGNDSWSDVAAPLEKYQVKAQPYHYSFYIVPFNSKTKAAGTKAKEIKF
ncbi:MAG: glycoside hydrolase family 2 TIM barrel-domain containing protein, partial [Chitinophagales bacterium]